MWNILFPVLRVATAQWLYNMRMRMRMRFSMRFLIDRTKMKRSALLVATLLSVLVSSVLGMPQTVRRNQLSVAMDKKHAYHSGTYRSNYHNHAMTIAM